MSRCKTYVGYTLQDGDSAPAAPPEPQSQPTSSPRGKGAYDDEIGGIRECRFYGEFGACRHLLMCGTSEKNKRVGTSNMCGCVWQAAYRNRCVNYQPSKKSELAQGFGNVLLLDAEYRGVPYIESWMERHPKEALTMKREYTAFHKKRDEGEKRGD